MYNHRGIILNTMLFLCVIGKSFKIHAQDLRTANIHNTIIGFDYNGVIAIFSSAQALEILKQERDSIDNKIVLGLLSIPIFVYGSYLSLTGKVPTYELCVEKLTSAFPPLKKYTALLLKITDEVILNADVIALIKSLHTQGYITVLASNTGSRSLALMQTKHKELFSIFNHHWLPYHNASNQLIAKPDVNYFVSWARHEKIQNPSITTIIFIDDKEKNVLAARRANEILKKESLNIQFIAFNFIDALQLEKDLAPLLL